VGIAGDIIDRADVMAADRINWVNVWIDIAKLVLPTESSETSFQYMMFGGQGSSAASATGARSRIGIGGPNSTARVKSIYDNTGMMSCDRLASGMESLVTPQSEKWHGLTVADVLHDKTTDEENIYLERLRNFQFALRYDPRAGFIPSHQKAMRSCVAFGTGVMYVEQDDGRPRAGDSSATPFRYQYCPLNENLLATNDYGNVDTNYRVRNFTVKQLVQKFGYKKVSSRVQAAWDNQEFETICPVIHAVCPRMEIGSYNLEGTLKGSQIASYYCEVDTKHLLDDGGFHEFPFAIYHWLQQDNGPYAESPVMLALSEIKSLQLMGKGELRAFGQWTDPPLGMPNDGVMNRPNLNPRAVNPGAVGPDGSLRVKPLITAQSPDFAEKVMEVRRAQVKETLYINLFQTLIKNPEMTATEAMIRSNEKGELLGPAGGKIQAGLSQMIDRELGIMTRRGVFRPASPLAAPQSLQGMAISVRMTSPLDRMRRANEGVGTTQLLNVALPMVKVKPDILDNFDLDKTLRLLREIFGAPAEVIVPETVMAANRQQSLQQQNMMKMMAMGKQGAEIAKDASIAGRNVGETANKAGETAQQGPATADALSGLLDRLKGGVSQNPAATQPAVDSTNALLTQFGKAPVPGASGFPSGG
jgi:hypothetical protein